MNILVRNLSEEMTEARLMAAFQRFGTVSSVSIVFDKTSGKSRGFGFVEMPDEAEANAAISALHHKNIDGMKIRVKQANPKYGPAYYTEGEGAQAVVQKLVPTHPPERPAAQTEKREFKPRRERSFDRPGERAGDKREFKPRGERSFAPGSAGARNDRPYSRYPKREGGGERPFSHGPRREGSRPSFGPRRERSFGPRSSGERSSTPYSRGPAREGGGRDFRPAGAQGGRPPFSHGPRREGSRPSFGPRREGSFGPRSAGERSSRPYSRGPAREGGSGRDFRPAGAQGGRPPLFHGPRREGSGPGFKPRDERSQGESPGFKPREPRSFERYRKDSTSRGGAHASQPRGERSSGPRSSGGKSDRPFSRFSKQGSGARDFKPRGSGPRS